MRRILKDQRLLAAVIMGLPCTSSVFGSATTYYWDPGHTPATPSGGDGIWGTSSDWTSNNSTNVAWDNWSGNSNTAVFGSTGGTVVLNRSGATTNAKGGLLFSNGGYTLNSNVTADTLTIQGSNAVNLTNAISTGDTVINAGLVLSGASTLTNNGAGSLYVNNVSGGSNGLTLLGAGKTYLSGFTATNTTGITLGSSGTTSGFLVLNGSNTYSGTTVVTSSSTLQLSGTAANSGLGSGNLILGNQFNAALGGGTLNVGAADCVIGNNMGLAANSTISGSYNLTVNGTFTEQGQGGAAAILTNNLDSGRSLTFAGATFSLSASGANGGVSFDGSGTTVISGILQNGGQGSNWTKNGTGQLMLSGSSSNTYTGNANINSGVMILNKSGTAQAIVGSNLNINDSAVVRYAVTAGGDQLNLTGAVQMKGGTLDLNGISDTIRNVTFIGGSAFASQITTGTGVLTTTTQTNYNTNGTHPLGATINGHMTAGIFNVLHSANANGVELDIQAELGGSSALQTTAASTGVLRISGNNTYTGATILNGGTVQLNHTGALGATSGVTINAGTLDLNGQAGFNAALAMKGNGGSGTGALINSSITAASYAGPITMTGATTIGAIGGDLNISGSITGPATPGTVTLSFGGDHNTIINGAIADGVGTAALALDKVGPGTLELTADNTYTGGTTVTAGVLLVNNTSGSATGTQAVTVQSGAILAGSGNISGAVTFLGGILAPGNSADTLRVGALTLDGESHLEFEFNATDHTIGGGINDLVVVNGDLVLAGTLDLGDTIGGGDLTPGKYRILSYSGLLTDNGLAIGTGFSTTYAYNVEAADGAVDLVVSLIPEPGLAGILGIVGPTLFLRRRRRILSTT